jgi:hypothetical protein
MESRIQERQYRQCWKEPPVQPVEEPVYHVNHKERRTNEKQNQESQYHQRQKHSQMKQPIQLEAHGIPSSTRRSAGASGFLILSQAVARAD